MDKLKQDGAETCRIIHLANVSERYRRSISTESDSSFVSESLSVPATAQSSSTLCNSIDDISMKSAKKKSYLKTHQLPMFLSKTYHMINRCDPEIATWSTNGDNFVIKNVDRFASSVLPQYFKHSNFSSFARQLNFYGFRKLKAEPILTAEYDSITASYVSFYHEKFHKDKPELMQEIKRATKSDNHSKDEVESLKLEIVHLKELVSKLSNDYERKIDKATNDFNQKLTRLSNQFDHFLATLRSNHLFQQQDEQEKLRNLEASNHSGAHARMEMSHNAKRPRYGSVITILHSQSPQSQLEYVNNAAQLLRNESHSHQYIAGHQIQNDLLHSNAQQFQGGPFSSVQDKMKSLHQACLSLRSPAGPQTLSVGKGSDMLRTQAHVPDDFKLPPSQPPC